MAGTADLPFLVKPKRQPIVEEIGNEDVGVISIERKGYITVAEKAFIQQASAGDPTVLNMHRLANRVASKNKIKPEKVIEILSKGNVADPIFDGFEGELEQVLGAMAAMEDKNKMISVTALILFRLSDAWTIEDTISLHPDLLEGIYRLYLDEEVRATAAFESKEEKKQPAAAKTAKK